MIEVSHVTKRFYSLPVLHAVSFHVKKGETYVVLGQSGVGKTVLLKILAGLLNPDSGHVRISTRSIGMLFQKNALFDSLTVQDNLDFPLREHTDLKAVDRRIKTANFLEWVGLSGCESLFPHELSGGMQKRLGIARALIIEPEVILYDEPIAGLDPITSRMIIDLITRLKAQFGTTIIGVTSDVLRAFQMADQVGLLVRAPLGATLIHAGTPAEARANPNAAIQQFLTGATKGPLTSALDDTAITSTDPSFSQLYAELENDPF